MQKLDFKDINQTFLQYHYSNGAKPFGPENMRPVFIVRKVADNGWSRIVKEDHVKFSLQQNNIVFSGIGFNMAGKFPPAAIKSN